MRDKEYFISLAEEAVKRNPSKSVLGKTEKISVEQFRKDVAVFDEKYIQPAIKELAAKIMEQRREEGK